MMCTKCRNFPRRGDGRWCRQCHNRYMRETRQTYVEFSPEQQRRAIARSHANMAQRRGALVPKPCEVCGSEHVEKHHDDYARPLVVRWLCRAHHRALHKVSRETSGGEA